MAKRKSTKGQTTINKTSWSWCSTYLLLINSRCDLTSER
jgi:hypothetical protein